jgi:hypothetical protein
MIGLRAWGQRLHTAQGSIIDATKHEPMTAVMRPVLGASRQTFGHVHLPESRAAILG